MSAVQERFFLVYRVRCPGRLNLGQSRSRASDAPRRKWGVWSYEEALALNPKLLSVYVEMITLYGQLGDLAQAAQVLKRSIDQIPAERDRLRKLYDGVQMRVLSQGRDGPGMGR